MNTTPARAKLSYGTAHFAPMSDDRMRRIYKAAWVAHAQVFGADETEALAAFERDSFNDTVLVAARGRRSIVHTCAFVNGVIGELCARDTVHIQASPESREWSQTEGGHTVFHASDETIALVEGFMETR